MTLKLKHGPTATIVVCYPWSLLISQMERIMVLDAIVTAIHNPHGISQGTHNTLNNVLLQIPCWTALLAFGHSHSSETISGYLQYHRETSSMHNSVVLHPTSLFHTSYPEAFSTHSAARWLRHCHSQVSHHARCWHICFLLEADVYKKTLSGRQPAACVPIHHQTP